eukprot:6181575-Pleurochrysis_carterae.AAC.1
MAFGGMGGGSGHSRQEGMRECETIAELASRAAATYGEKICLQAWSSSRGVTTTLSFRDFAKHVHAAASVVQDVVSQQSNSQARILIDSVALHHY